MGHLSYQGKLPSGDLSRATPAIEDQGDIITVGFPVVRVDVESTGIRVDATLGDPCSLNFNSTPL